DRFEIDCTTTALFIVAGWSIGKYQLNTIIKTDQVNSIIAMMISICIPTILYTVFVQLWRFKGQEFHWESILLYSNFIDFNIDKDDGYNFWFIMVLVQSLAMIFIMFSLKPIRQLVKKNAYRFAVAATIFFFIVAVAGGIVWDTGAPIHHRVPHLKLWLLFFGMAIALADTKARRMLMNAMAIGIFWILWNVSEDISWFPREAFFSPWETKNVYPWFPLIATLFIINMRRVSVPKLLTPAINLIAGASLFIYLMNMQFYGLFKHTPIAKSLPLATLFAVLGSIFIWKVWEQLAAKCHMFFYDFMQKNYPMRTIGNNKKEDRLIH
ncbi:MAG: hypothetical protein Q8J65_06190, partial [Nitrosomonadales bacterium]|nr:hypothetical protein [Nitrosomonadales bacterium]